MRPSSLDWLLPAKIKIIVRAILSKNIGFSKVDSWETAVATSSGYGSEQVVEPIVQSASELRDEIQSTTFSTSRYQQIAAAFLYCLTEKKNLFNKSIKVLDVGGGGGDYFYQFCKFAPNLHLDWTVLETTALAQAMQTELGSSAEKIKWIDSLENAERSYDIILCSSVLQYLEKPFETLNELSTKSRFIILNRLPLVASSDHFVALQRIITKGKRGSYPAHFFSEQKFIKQLESYGFIPMRWEVTEDQPVVGWKAYPNQGLLLCIDQNSTDQSNQEINISGTENEGA